MAVHPDGGSLVVGLSKEKGGSYCCWVDASSGKVLEYFNHHSADCRSVAISPGVVLFFICELLRSLCFILLYFLNLYLTMCFILLISELLLTVCLILLYL